MLGFAVPRRGQAANADLACFASTAEELGPDSPWVGHLDWAERLVGR